MLLYLDLEPWRMMIDDPAILAVGWIGPDGPYPTGPTPAAAFEKLTELCVHPWAPVATTGFHSCALCQYDGPRLKGEVYVPGPGCIYVAPVGILHYIAAHWYTPPPVFVQAVLDCPPMRSMAYKRALLENGGRALLAKSTA